MHIRSELKSKPHQNTACVFLTWTILQTEMDGDFRGIAYKKTAKSHVFLLMKISYPYIAKFHENRDSNF